MNNSDRQVAGDGRACPTLQSSQQLRDKRSVCYFYYDTVDFLFNSHLVILLRHMNTDKPQVIQCH